MLNVTGLLNELMEVMVTTFCAELPPPMVMEDELSPKAKSEETVTVNTA